MVGHVAAGETLRAVLHRDTFYGIHSALGYAASLLCRDVEICAEKKVKITCEDFELHSRKSTTLKVDTDMSVTVKQNLTEKVSQSISRKSDQDTKQEAGTSMDVKAGTSATFKAGTTGDVSAGATLKCSSPSSTFSGDAMCTVKGGMVMIN